MKRIATPQKKQIEARRKSLRSATKESTEESIEPVVEAAVIEAHEPQNTTRTILKAKRRLGNQTKVMQSVVPEIPRRVSFCFVALNAPRKEINMFSGNESSASSTIEQKYGAFSFSTKEFGSNEIVYIFFRKVRLSCITATITVVFIRKSSDFYKMFRNIV